MTLMNRHTRIMLIALLTCTFYTGFSQAGKPRLVVLADMGNEKDEEQQITHLMLYLNEFDLEGLVAVTGKFLRPESKDPYKQMLHPELFHSIIDAYSLVVDNLKKHAEGWPEPGYLHSIVFEGQKGYGVAATGKGMSSGGSRHLLKVLNKDDPRPLYIVVNAGSNTLAQALIDYRASHSQAEVDAVVAKIRVYENGAQDDAGAWICHQFPAIHWVRSNYQTYCYAGPGGDGGANNKGDRKNLGPHTWEPYAYSSIGQHQWALEHIIGNHGPLGVKYPLRQFPKGGIGFLEGGGTIPWLCLIHQGLSDIDNPHWGGWSGRFTKEKAKNVWSKHNSVNKDEKNYTPFALYTEAPDSWKDPRPGEAYHKSIYAPVWRWRRAFFNDVKGRMDWCKNEFDQANHPPKISINDDASEKIHIYETKKGASVVLDASASTDPDGDKLNFKWWQYPEAGTYDGELSIPDPSNPVCEVLIPKDAKGKEIHLILEVNDDNKIVSMYDYRRIVFVVE